MRELKGDLRWASRWWSDGVRKEGGGVGVGVGVAGDLGVMAVGVWGGWWLVVVVGEGCELGFGEGGLG